MLNYVGNWIGERIKTPFNNLFKDNVNTAWKFASESLLDTKSEGGVGALGILKETALNIWNTVKWGGERSIFNQGTDSWNPFERHGKLNPIDKLRRFYSGTVESITNLYGNLVALHSPRIGNAIRDISSNTLHGIGGLLLGDMDEYREISKQQDRVSEGASEILAA